MDSFVFFAPAGVLLVIIIASYFRLPRRCPSCGAWNREYGLECSTCHERLPAGDLLGVGSQAEWAIAIPRRGFYGDIVIGPGLLFFVGTLLVGTSTQTSAHRPSLFFYAPMILLPIVMGLNGIHNALGWETIEYSHGELTLKQHLFGRVLATRRLPIEQSTTISSEDAPAWTHFVSMRRERRVPMIVARTADGRIRFGAGLDESLHEELAASIRTRMGLPAEQDEPGDGMFDDSIGGRIAERIMRL